MCGVTIPAGSAAGAWAFTQADVRDNVGNFTVVSGAAATQLAAGITVSSTSFDTTLTPPHLTLSWRVTEQRDRADPREATSSHLLPLRVNWLIATYDGEKLQFLPGEPSL